VTGLPFGRRTYFLWRGGPQPFEGCDTPPVWHFDVNDDASNPAFGMRSSPSDSFLKFSTWRPSCASLFSTLVINCASAGWHSISSTDSFLAWFIRLPARICSRTRQCFHLQEGGKKELRKPRARDDFSFFVESMYLGCSANRVCSHVAQHLLF
jgi:hypothetical protein